MAYIVYIILGLIVFGVLGSLAWRIASHRQEIPCPAWLGWMVELDNPFARVIHARFVVDHLELEPGMTALDAGCGPGRVTLPLAEAVGPRGDVLAMDVQAGMIERVRAKVEASGLQNVRYLQAGLGQGQLPPNHYDRAVLVTVLGEIPDQLTALKELHNTLKPGGILSVSETIFDPHFQPRQAVLQAAQAAGFREKTFFGNRLAYTMHLEKTVEDQSSI